jgi:uncharacterized protein
MNRIYIDEKRRISYTPGLMSLGDQRFFMLLLPLLLTVSTAIVFKCSSIRWGLKPGYLVGFLFYWSFWCITIPVIMLRFKSIKTLFSWKKNHLSITGFLYLLLPLVFVYSYAFPRALRGADLIIIVLSLLISIVNGTLEEILWRGVYAQVFTSKWFTIIYSAIGFAIWHYAPQVIFPNRYPGGVHSFVVFCFLLGLIYAHVTCIQRSLFWVSLAHILFDFAGVGARIYF